MPEAAAVMVIGGFWFWSLILAEIIFLLVSTETDHFGWAFTSIVAFGLLLNFAFDINLFLLAKNHPTQLLVIAIAYVLIGGLWALYRWSVFMKKWRVEYDKTKIAWMKSEGIAADAVWDEKIKASWKRNVERYYDSQLHIPNPRSEENSLKIAKWWGFWVFSMLGYAIFDLLADFFRMLSDYFSSLFQSITKRFSQDVEEDFKT